MQKELIKVKSLSITRIDLFFSGLCFVMILGFMYKGLYILNHQQALFSSTSKITR